MKPTKLLIVAALLSGATAFAGNTGMKTTSPSTPSTSDHTGTYSKDMVKGDRAMEGKKFFHAAIDFAPGSAVLSEEHKAKLRQLVREVRSSRDIEQVTIAAWSDKALPMKDAKLLDSDKDLAERRADAIRDIVRMELGVSDIDAYNMAEPANWLARTFNTKDAELKSVFGRTAEETPVTREEFQLIKDAGAPGKAVVVAEYDIDDTMNTPAQTPTTP